MSHDRPPRPGTPARGSRTGRPIMAALDLLGRRWTLRVIWELSRSPLGFRDLQRRCDQMSSSVLATRLDELVQTGVVAASGEGYRLTELGEELREAIRPLQRWAARWQQALEVNEHPEAD